MSLEPTWLRMIAQRDMEIARLSMDNRVLTGENERLRVALAELKKYVESTGAAPV